MNVVCTFDNNYVPHAATMLTSLLFFNQNVNIYCISNDIDNRNIALLKSLIADRLDSTLEIIIINADEFRDYKFGKQFDHLSIATYFRILIPNLLPISVEKVLYLDCDIIINSSLEELWSTDISECALAGVEDQKINTVDGPKRLGYKKVFSYINAGVLLLNIKFLRNIGFVQKALDFLKNSKNLLYHDQDVLNAVLFDKKKIVDAKWNVMDFMFIPKYSEGVYKNLFYLRKSPAVIHYTGKLKPWYKECNHPYKYLYKIFREANGVSFKPIMRYRGIDKLSYKFKMMLKYVLYGQAANFIKFNPEKIELHGSE